MVLNYVQHICPRVETPCVPLNNRLDYKDKRIICLFEWLN